MAIVTMSDQTPCVFDIETVGLPNAADFLEPVQPDSRLRDPEKIKADIAEKEEKRLEKLALDWNTGRIVALGYWINDRSMTWLCKDEFDELAALTDFWKVTRARELVGFAIKQFDLRFLVQRSRYLGVPYPQLDFGKYSKRGITDLFLELTFNDGVYDQGAMRRTLKAFARRFGIPVDDSIDGKDIPALAAKGDWEAIRSHVESDVQLTLALARKLGVVQPEPVGVL